MGLLARLLGNVSGGHDLVADLTEAYTHEVEHAVTLRAHAERARYPHVAAELRRLAQAEDHHAGELRDRIVARGGTVPTVSTPPLAGNSQWQRAVAALQQAQRKRKRLVEQIVRWDVDEPDVAVFLRKVEQDDARELPVYEQLVMRSDPHALD